MLNLITVIFGKTWGYRVAVLLVMGMALLAAVTAIATVAYGAAQPSHKFDCHVLSQSTNRPYTLTMACNGDCKHLRRALKGTARYALIHRICHGRETWR